ncbi:phosphopantetheine-binding protein, partial [Nonomuraea jabiensis]|uniref:phosphopantetheine-binding protein n=1 Tax=Nonomuraea jabiensis TaxID=882448 RepID=UPI003D7178F3
MDQQVKIRGFRIELGEVEAALGAQAGVLQAAVVVREERPDDKRLVGYVVARPGAALQSTQLRVALAGMLPDYMVPSALVFLESLPVTPNGKLDRETLSALDYSGIEEKPGATAAIREPRTPREELLCDLFAEVLGVEQVGIDDNFFDLGGHSLLAARLISRIRATLNRGHSVRTLFEAPTPALLAKHL